ncbi:MAG: thioredoxin domain-containing protein [Angustibacter sp.]
MNRLAGQTSPYLLQHADNPVDWWPWGADAFAEARRRDVPVLLSVGYAACHWCHVMAHESFEDVGTATQVNAGFVAVKVDRDERPDVDATYMAATVALSGHGGWPMTVFLTPDGAVFQAGTYYPPSPRPGVPSFRQLLTVVSEAWRDRRGDVQGAAARITAALSEHRGQHHDPADPSAGPSGSGRSGRSSQVAQAPVPPSQEALATAVDVVLRDEDRECGGFGGAPKFPPSMVLEWLLRHAARVGTGQVATGHGAEVDGAGSLSGGGSAADAAADTGDRALAAVGRTLRAMAAGGIHDQLEGGFARYAVDAGWVVPHFEKMLYDNALLARVYLHWWRLTGEPLGRRVAEQTCDWMLRRLRTDGGGLASSLDADTDGVEGSTYVWTPGQLVEVLGADDGAWAAQLLGVTADGTFEHGTSTLRMLRDLDAGPGDSDAGPVDSNADPAPVHRWHSIRERLSRARDHRTQPARDDTVIAAWNGLAVAALAETGALFDRPDLVDAAGAAAAAVLGVHLVDGRLRRVSRDGVAGEPGGVLEDHGDLAEGLFALYAVTGEPRWWRAADELATAVAVRFVGPDGKLRDTAVDAVDPMLRAAAGDRLADPADNAHPSGASAAAGALLTAASIAGDARRRLLAETALDQVRQIAAQHPRFAGWGLAVAEAAADGPREVAVVGPLGDPRTRALCQAAWLGAAPGLVIAIGDPAGPELSGLELSGAAPSGAGVVPLLSDRDAPGGVPTAYPCRGQVCDLPTSDPSRLAAFILARAGGGPSA